MSVKLQFYDAASKLLDTTIGLDLGKVRRGYDHISTIYVKNDGDEAARNVSITSTAEDSADADSVLASNWQTFSLDGKTYSSTLDLGVVEAGKFATGQDIIVDSFKDTSSSIFKYLLGSAKQDFTPPILTYYQDDSTSQSYGRSQLALENAKNIDFSFKMGYTYNKETFNSLPSNQQNVSMAIFAARINGMGNPKDNDNTGYLIEFFTSPKYENKFQLKITVGGKGIAGQSDRSYGTIIADTGSTWLDYYPLLTNFRIRLYNNEDGVPCFEFYKDNEQIDLYKYAWSENRTSTSRTNEKVKVFEDSDKTYTTGGKTYFDVNLQKGSLSYRLSDFTISYDNVKAPIYIKTHIDDSGINGQKYTSTATLIYQD